MSNETVAQSYLHEIVTEFKFYISDTISKEIKYGNVELWLVSTHKEILK